jgi:predicted metal-dependent phosphoesterase TrpH
MLNEKEMRVKVDLHVHTVYSPDSLITLEELVFLG